MGGGEWGDTPYNGQVGAEKGTFLRLEVHTRAGILRILGIKMEFQNILNRSTKRLTHPSILRDFSSENSRDLGSVEKYRSVGQIVKRDKIFYGRHLKRVAFPS